MNKDALLRLKNKVQSISEKNIRAVYTYKIKQYSEGERWFIIVTGDYVKYNGAGTNINRRPVYDYYVTLVNHEEFLREHYEKYEFDAVLTLYLNS